MTKAEFRPKEPDDDDEVEEIPEEIRIARHGRPPLVLWAKFAWHKQGPFPFGVLSGGERGIIFISGAMLLAEYCCRYRGALLVLDLGSNFDDKRLSDYAERLQHRDFRFQTILISHSLRPKVDWTGWSIARLIGCRPNVRFDQTQIADEQLTEGITTQPEASS